MTTNPLTRDYKRGRGLAQKVGCKKAGGREINREILGNTGEQRET